MTKLQAHEAARTGLRWERTTGAEPSSKRSAKATKRGATHVRRRSAPIVVMTLGNRPRRKPAERSGGLESWNLRKETLWAFHGPRWCQRDSGE